jgi:CO/xanthine dehydrogenase FAD-binding subunit
VKIMDRDAWTHAMVSVAVVLDVSQGICSRAEIVLGGVAPIPWQVSSAASMLVGQQITEDLAGKVGQVAVEGARPLAKNGYKVQMTQALVKRTLISLTRQAA